VLRLGDDQIASGLNTAQKGYALFFLRFAHMGCTHGLKGNIVPGQYPHPAYAASAAAAAMADGTIPGSKHSRKYRLILGAGEAYSRILNRYGMQ
jgi:hypothetical protein